VTIAFFEAQPAITMANPTTISFRGVRCILLPHAIITCAALAQAHDHIISGVRLIARRRQEAERAIVVCPNIAPDLAGLAERIYLARLRIHTGINAKERAMNAVTRRPLRDFHKVTRRISSPAFSAGVVPAVWTASAMCWKLMISGA